MILMIWALLAFDNFSSFKDVGEAEYRHHDNYKNYSDDDPAHTSDDWIVEMKQMIKELF